MKSKQKQKKGQIYICWTAHKIITKLFKNFDLKIFFKANNTIGKVLKHNKNTNFNKHNKCRVFQLTYLNCNKKIY